MEHATSIIDRKDEKCPVKEDADSGLDNLSDTSSDDETIKTTSSESDEIHAVQPVRPERKVKKKVSLCVDIEFDLDRFPSADFFRTLTKGQQEPVDFGRLKSLPRPDWLDEEKFKRGQKFAAANLFSLNFAEMLSLIMLFAPKSILRPLIFTRKSDTPYRAFRRYLSTVTRLKSWYEDDVWCAEESSAKQNIERVNKMHKSLYERLTELTPEEIEAKSSLGDEVWCTTRDIVIEDFRTHCPVGQFCKAERDMPRVWVSQWAMSITQFGFIGLAVTYPEYFGLHYTPEEDLDAFCHMWRGLGYLLGIKDEYNFCNGDLQVVRQRTKDYIEMTVKPSFREVTPEWEHMCRCMITGISFYVPVVEFESSLLYLCYVIDIKVPKLSRSVTYGQYFKFLAHKCVNFLQRIPGVQARLNRRLNEFIKNAQNASPEQLAKWEAMEFPYMNRTHTIPIVWVR